MTRAFPFIVSALLALLAGCTTHGTRPGEEPARLAFANVGTVKGFLGSFRTLDGKPIDGTQVTLELSAGRHTIGYWCPDHLVMDGPPTVSATFEAGKSYVLHCHANQPGRVEQR